MATAPKYGMASARDTALADADVEELLGFELAVAAIPDPPERPRESWGIVGYRFFTDRGRFDRELTSIVEARGQPARVVSGGATGADTLARTWAAAREIAFVEHLPASNRSRDLLARNTLIVRDSDLIVAFLSALSRGTYDTINKARRAGKEVIIIDI